MIVVIKRIRPALVGIISILFIVTSCSVAGYKPITKSEKFNINNPLVFNSDFKRSIYKTNIDIYSINLTGLTLFKKSDSAYRVVAMSELGMKYFDIEFPVEELLPPKIHYIMEVLDKKLLVNMLKKDFGLLFYPPELNVSNISVNDANPNTFLVKKKKLGYVTTLAGNISEINKVKFLGSMKSIVVMSEYNNESPNRIIIDHGSIKLDFEIIN